MTRQIGFRRDLPLHFRKCFELLCMCLSVSETMSSESLQTRSSLLLQLRSKDDSAAWSRFVSLYTPLVDRWIAELGFDDPDRADLVQDVLVTLLGKVSTFQYDPQRTFRGWLRVVLALLPLVT